MTFTDLIHGAELDYAPPWLRDFWDECQWLQDEIQDWTDTNGEYRALDYVTEFRKQSYGYIKAGLIAHTVRTKRIYLNITQSFTAFCEKWLGRSIWQVDRLIKASELAVKLIAMGFTEIPATESQARSLTRLNDRDLEEVWLKVCRFIPEKDRTAKNIEAIANRLNEVDPDFAGKPPSKRIELKADQWDLLEQKAAKYGMKPKEYLDLLLRKDLGDEPEPEPEPIPTDEPQPRPITEKPKSKGFGFVALPNLLPKLLTTEVNEPCPTVSAQSLTPQDNLFSVPSDLKLFGRSPWEQKSKIGRDSKTVNSVF